MIITYLKVEKYQTNRLCIFRWPCDAGRNGDHWSFPNELANHMIDRFNDDMNALTLWHLDLKLAELVNKEDSETVLKAAGKNLANFVVSVLGRAPRLKFLVGNNLNTP